MASILQSLNKTIIAGIILTLILFFIIFSIWPESNTWLSDTYFWGTVVFRYLHVLSGIMWIGLLWYFNFVQIPNMPNIPDEQKPAIGKVIAPAALFWFRWAALSTIITGLIVAYLSGYVNQAMTTRISWRNRSKKHNNWHWYVVRNYNGLQCLDDHMA